MSVDPGQLGKLGIAGSTARFFLHSKLTPLLAVMAFLLGVFAIAVTPREEEPQVDMTSVNVLIPFPGASAKNVEQLVAGPAEQALAQMTDVDHVLSLSRPGLAIITVQFKVGVPRTEALVRLYDVVSAHADWFLPGLGVGTPIVKPMGVDDVPIVALTLWSKDRNVGAYDLERIAHSIESDLKRVAGTRAIATIGGPGHVITVELDPARLAASKLTVSELSAALQLANHSASLGDLLAGNQAIAIDSAPYLASAAELAEVVVGVKDGKPLALADVANITDGPPPAQSYVWHGLAGKGGGEFAAITLTISKKTGENAVTVASNIIKRVAALKNTVIPANVEVTVSRNYGETANEKAVKLIQKLFFATLAVVVLVFFTLGRREAVIVGLAVILTLMVTLFASWAWGFTLNRISLFALIFSIGILVDDAIVVIENIHRHQQIDPARTLNEIIPPAVDEVGGPTILATFTVIAALLPLAFINNGLMRPYMSPIPINASMGMLVSLIIALVITPWLARLLMHSGSHAKASAFDRLMLKLQPLFARLFQPFMDARRGRGNRLRLGLVILLLLGLSAALPVFGWVYLKTLPFDNKSEFQVLVDMPAGTPVEQTAAVLHALTEYLAQQPEVANYQAYAGTSSPITFNGMVRQYNLRASGELGDIQVNLLDKHLRHEKSHVIAERFRTTLQAIGLRFGANVKVVEVPPGPPVFSPIVAEIYGADDQARFAVARAVRQVFEQQPEVVDIDSTGIAAAPRKVLLVDRRKAALSGVSQAAIVATLRAGLSGEASTYLHDQSRSPTATVLRLPMAAQGDLNSLLQLGVKNAQGRIVPLRELVTVSDSLREQPLYHKDLLAVHYVTADMAGRIDSPIYAMFAMRDNIGKIVPPGGGQIAEFLTQAPADPYRGFSLKWGGEWQFTVETFRAMGAAYAIGLLLIYLLIVAQFGSYLMPLVIMAPIPLTLIGVLPGHALLGAQFSATSMVGMIALAGIIVRNSILLVDFINLQISSGIEFNQAIVNSVIERTRPIALTGLAAMIGALFILDDPMFNGLAISLIFGILVSTLLTLVVIPLLYFSVYAAKFKSAEQL